MSRAADIALAQAQIDRAARLLRALAYPGLPGKPRGAPPIRLRCAPRPAPAGWAVVRGAAVPIDRPQAVLIAAAAALAGLAAGAIALRLVA